MQGCLGFMRRTLSGNEFAPRSLKGSLNFRTSLLPVKRTLMVIGASGDDGWEFVAMIDDEARWPMMVASLVERSISRSLEIVS